MQLWFLCFLQVAEMHGELMEFNEMLHRQLNAKDAVLRQLRQELVTLRGPVRLVCLFVSIPLLKTLRSTQCWARR